MFFKKMRREGMKVKIFSFLVSFSSVLVALTNVSDQRLKNSANRNVQKPITRRWRKKVFNDFDEYVTKIKKIITDGEEEAEKDDFVNKFREQRSWFDKTVTGTQYFLDPSYNAVMQKCEALETLVKAFDRAEEILKKQIKQDEVSETVLKKMRLVILYDVNAAIQDNVEKGFIDLEFGILEANIERIVDTTINLFKKERYGVEFVIQDETAHLEREIDKIKKELKEKTMENVKLKKDFKGRLEEGKKTRLHLELLLEQAKANREKLKKEIEDKTRSHLKGRFGKQIEEEKKKNLALQLRLLDLEKDVIHLKQEASLLESWAKKEEKVKKSVQADAKKKVTDAKKQVLSMKLKVQRQMDYIKATDKMLKNKERLLSQLSVNLKDRQQFLKNNIKILEHEKLNLLERKKEVFMLQKEAKNLKQEASKYMYEKTKELEKKEYETEFKIQKMLEKAKKDLENTKRKILETEFAHASYRMKEAL
jgi:hypothetical protein